MKCWWLAVGNEGVVNEGGLGGAMIATNKAKLLIVLLFLLLLLF